nr:MAG TPA: hypothetical protein [Caudoviricetes sp.]
MRWFSHVLAFLAAFLVIVISLIGSGALVVSQ